MERGRQGIEGTLAKWNGLHQNTLAAVCRGGGRTKTTTGLHDLSPDLTKPLLDSIAFTWDEFFGERLTQVMRDWYGKLKDLAGRHAETFRETVAGRLKAGSVLKANLARLQEATEKVLAEQLEQSRTQMQERIDRTRGTLYERVPDRVRAVLRPTFEKAGKESGKGMKQRIIEDHLRPAVFAVARDVFRDAEQEIEAELRVLQDTLTRAYAEMAGTVHRHAQLNVDNLWQGAHELSTEGIEAERKRLATAAGKLAELAAAA